MWSGVNIREVETRKLGEKLLFMISVFYFQYPNQCSEVGEVVVVVTNEIKIACVKVILFTA